MFTVHPFMQYLLIYENKSMKSDLRILYILSHVRSNFLLEKCSICKVTLILNEWCLSMAIRFYPAMPIAALYCEGPLCRAGIDKQILMVTSIFKLYLGFKIISSDLCLYSCNPRNLAFHSIKYKNAPNGAAYVQ